MRIIILVFFVSLVLTFCAITVAGMSVGEVFSDCNGCPKVIVVPGGSYEMGSLGTESGRGNDEGPVHRVSIRSPFAVGIYEITFDEWALCVADGGCLGYIPDDVGWGRGRLPVMDVSWLDAKNYTTWLNGKSGVHYRLLTEAEWEYVARAGTTTKYWWGNKRGRDNARCDGCSQRNDKRTAPVGSFKPNAFGLFDVHGNVWEWVEDCWSQDYSGVISNGGVVEESKCNRKVVRGGSWSTSSRHLRSANRSWKGRNYIGIGVDHGKGFRVARSL